MKPLSPLFALLVSVVLFGVGVSGTDRVVAIDTIGLSAPEDDSPVVEWGFQGQVRLGHWTPVRFQLDSISSGSDAKRFEVECPDSNGTRVIYSGELSIDPKFPKIGQGLFRLGRNQGRADVRLLDAESTVVFELADVVIGSEGLSVLLSTQSANLFIESDGKTAEVMMSGGIGPEVVLEAAQIDRLPNNSLMYGGIDQIYLSLNDPRMSRQLSDVKLAALTEWVLDGGRLIVSGGPLAVEFFQDNGRAKQLCPGTPLAVAQIESSSRINFFINGSTPLIGRDELPVSVLPVEAADARALLVQDDLTLVVHGARGLGQLTYVGLDMDSERFQNWSDSVAFVNQVFGNLDDVVVQSDADGGRRVSHFGYEDMVGQLRAPLDQFANVKFISFTWVALLIGLFILFIGPADYFFLRKLVGRMELTWVTFSLIAISFCAIAFIGNRYARPDQMQINQLEIVDVDVATGRIRGTMWANIYGPRTESVDLSMLPASGLGVESASGWLSWQGLPGTGLGGMSSKTVSNLGNAAYESRLEWHDGTGLQGNLTEVPFQVSSSRSFLGQWRGKQGFEFLHGLKYNVISEQIQGTVTNPLDVELRNCRIYFENWVYVFDQPFGPGETVDLLSETGEKNIKSFMTRRQTNETKTTTTAWDPTDTNIGRIANMMMFHAAAGGVSYTKLTNDYQSFVDMSELLTLDRAILVGESTELVSAIEVRGNSSAIEYDRHSTLFRFVIPVKELKRRRTSKP